MTAKRARSAKSDASLAKRKNDGSAPVARKKTAAVADSDQSLATNESPDRADSDVNDRLAKLGMSLSTDDVARFPEENPNPVLRADRGGTLLYANPAAVAVLTADGWQVGEKLPESLRARMIAVVAGNHDVEWETKGSTFSVTAAHVGQDVGHNSGINLYLMDISRRKQAEAALRESEERQKAIEVARAERQRLYDVLETLPVYVILLTPDYHVDFANRFFEERFGKSDGRRCFEYLFDRTEPCEDCETYKVLKSGASHRWAWTGPDGCNYDIHDFPFTDSDGSPLIMEVGIDVTDTYKARAALEEANKTLERRVAERTAELARANNQLRSEIEERRKAEAALLAVKEDWERTFHTVPDLIAILDDQHRITRVNPAMARALNATPEQCVGLPCFRCVHGTNSPPDGCPLDCTLADGCRHSVEIVEERLGGDFLVTTTPMFGEKGELIGAVHVARDITEQKRAEQTLRELNETLEQRVAERTAVAEQRARHLRRLAAQLSQVEHRERKRLAALLHDDLQQLLLAARLHLAGLANDDDPRLLAEVEKVDGLLDECLGVSRDLTQELSPPILHWGTLGETLEWLGEWFGQKHRLAVAINVLDELSPLPEHVRIFLFQAVRELLINVVKHSGRMGARVTLSAVDDYLVVDVEDDGEHFDPKTVQPKLDRAHSFGLPNIRERLEALEGRLEVEATRRGGARFRLIVPVRAVAEAILP